MENKRRLVEKELSEALGSEGKIKILRLLAEKPNNLFTMYSILKSTGLRRQDTNKHIQRLCDIEWVKQQTYGVKKYQLNLEKKEVRNLIDFLRAVEAI